MSQESRSSRSPSATPINRTVALPDSSEGSSPRVSSPLNGGTTPKKTTVALPSPEESVSPVGVGKRVHSSSDSLDGPLRPLSMTLTSAQGDSSSISLPELYNDKLSSTFRERSRSPTGRDSKDQAAGLPAEAASSKLSSSWWGEAPHVARPWQDGPKRKKTVPPDQALALEETRKRVAQAIASALGTAADIAHEALFVGVEFFDMAPIPGLSLAARTLLNIWDAAQNVDMNRLGCLRLTERCADILISVREEVHEAGDAVGAELAAPLAKLEEAYTHVYRFMVKQTNRPWLKRYLKRDEILKDIAFCDSMLRDALGLFGISIQIRILRQVQETEKRRERETSSVLNAILAGRLPPPTPDLKMVVGSEMDVASSGYSSETVTQFATTTSALGLIDNGTTTPTQHQMPSSEILPTLANIHTIQNSLDAARDLGDLRQLMRAALQTSSDAEMLEVLQIGRQEMPDAIKTLQRALERLAERETDGFEAIPAKGIVLGKIVTRVAESPDDTRKRSETIISIESTSSSGTSGSLGSSTETRKRDTLDWEFIETGIDALRRMSRGVETSVPSWTITKYEVDRDEKIGIGFFSDVYKGTWRGRTVAIKVLAETTPRKLFVREIGIWKALRHPNVLPLYGASSATGDPPWFFVSPYLKNGTLAEHLRRVELEERPPGLGIGSGASHVAASMTPRSQGGRATTLPSPWIGLQSPSSSSKSLTPPGLTKRPLPVDNNEVQREWDLFRLMHEIAKGMEYLHGEGVLHGDLKASNVLVDNRYRCVISDFGQSEMKSEAFRISGTPPPHGTLRWQSPEFMAGRSQLTPEVDVWAFSISCVEILTMGRMPWPFMDDNAVRHFVLKENTRPPIPKFSRFNTPGLQDILRACWQAKPEQRPTFTKIARDLKLLRKGFGHDAVESPRLPSMDDIPEHTTSPSPDMRPIDLPSFLQGAMPPADILVGSLDSNGTYHTAREGSQTPEQAHPYQESTVVTAGMKMPEPVIFTPGPSSRSSSILVPSIHSEDHIDVIDMGYESPPPLDERAADMKNEMRYRLLLTHEFHPSLTLPLWDPSPIEIGAVGYLCKPKGNFVTLFNAYDPRKSYHPGIQLLPSIHGYGDVKDDVQRLPKKTVTQKALDMIIGSLAFRNSSASIARRQPFPLTAGHKAAYLYTEVTEYRYMVSLDAPKKWFQSNVDAIMSIYGYSHHIHKEDLFLVIGTLRTPNYAILVSHRHPNGHARFNVYANPQIGQPWGTFTTDTEVSQGPSYEEPSEIPLTASKVSMHGESWDAVLLARLRFKPDILEPTSK
ncbi:hypothetical protein GALMADRAFT_245050, partial [Galerina marginata CBS 339.88]